MNSEKKLEALREEIDTIDDAIHDLIMRRTEVVSKVREAKEGEWVKIRPAREAEILYRLLSQHKGAFPRRELCRMWRELIVATLSMEGPFSVAVYMSGDSDGYWDLARDQYGSYTPMTRHATERRVIDAVGSQEATVGVLPLPRWDDPDPWWRHLVNGGDRAPKIIARLPFTGVSNSLDKGLEAFVISPVETHPTGRDHSFFIVETKTEITLSRLAGAFSANGLNLASSAVWSDPHASDAWMYLAETDRFVTSSDRRISELGETLPLSRVLAVGGYATPFEEEELDTPPAKSGGEP